MKKAKLTVLALALSSVFASSANAGFVDEAINKVKSVLGLSKPTPPAPPVILNTPPVDPAPTPEGATAEPAAPDLLVQQPTASLNAKKDSKVDTKSVTAVKTAEPGIYDDIGINPFTGKPLTLEQRQRRLDVLKSDSQYLEEQIKQQNLRYELDALPVRKQAELAAMRGVANGNNGASQAAAPSPVVQKVKKAKRSKPVGEPLVVAPTVIVPQAPAVIEPRYEVVSIMGGANSKSAILSVDGRNVSVRDGQNSEFGKISIPDGERVVVGNKTISIRQGINRVYVSDASTGAINSVAGGTPLQTAPVQAAPQATGGQAGGFVPSLPPLPLR